ncbi:transcriptional regulator [Streptomyces sp. NPDC050704]|uniref:helix-turn-helix domain-containing protein n=1 Tax=Streptomyces sp. NPDC050704 TaxID=3157219 RepID=UPI00341EA75C
MPRPEKPIAFDAPFAAFALQLRALRRQAGNPTYDAMSRRIGGMVSVSTLAKAAAGDRLPSLEVTLAYATACHGNQQHWTEQWLLAQGDALPSQAGAWATVPPTASTAASAADFVEALRQLRLWAGMPSYTQLARLAGLGRTTLCDALAPGRAGLPSRDVTSRLVLACMHHAYSNRSWLSQDVPIAVTAEQAQRAFLHMWHQIASQELARRHVSGTGISATPRPSASVRPRLPVRPTEEGSGTVKEQQYVGLIDRHEALDRSIRPEMRELADALRTLFASLEISMRHYAARTYMDPGSLSRYLSGKRVPPRSFIEDLVRTAREDGVPLSEYSHEHLFKLYENALRSSPYPGDQLSLLNVQHEAAQQRIRELQEEIHRLKGG